MPMPLPRLAGGDGVPRPPSAAVFSGSDRVEAPFAGVGEAGASDDPRRPCSWSGIVLVAHNVEALGRVTETSTKG